MGSTTVSPVRPAATLVISHGSASPSWTHTAQYDPVIDNDIANIDRYFRAQCMSAMLDGEVVVAEAPGVGVVGVSFWCVSSDELIWKRLNAFSGMARDISSLRRTFLASFT